MLAHAPIPTIKESDDPHPEQPARISGIYDKLVGELKFFDNSIFR